MKSRTIAKVSGEPVSISIHNHESKWKWLMIPALGLTGILLTIIHNADESRQTRTVTLAARRAEIIERTSRDLAKIAYLKGFQVTYQIKMWKMIVEDSAASVIAKNEALAWGSRLDAMSWTSAHIYENRFAREYPLEYQGALDAERFSSEVTATLAMVQMYFYYPEIDSLVNALATSMSRATMISTINQHGNDPLLRMADERSCSLMFAEEWASITTDLLTAMALRVGMGR